MAITTGDQLIAAAKQVCSYNKVSATVVANARYTIAQAAGNPGPLALPGTATPSGAVPTDVTAGYVPLNTFGGSNTGYLTRVAYAASVAERIELWDKLYAVGITAVQLGTLQTLTLSAQPSYSGRVPGGTNFSGTRIFVEITTLMAATATTINVTYTNQAGTTGRTAVATASLSAFVAGRWVELTLAAGDSGVQKIETVIIGGATNATGVLNVIVARRLWQGRVNAINYCQTDGPDKTGMPQVWETSALVATVIADSTASGVVDFDFDIANG